MSVIALSPHLDDVVWSAGATLAGLTDVTLVTVFAGSPPGGLVTAFDRGCGFGTSAEAIAARIIENDRACHVLADTTPLNGAWLDSQYGTPATEAELTAWMVPLFKRKSLVLSPLGIGHPDHRVVACAARVAARQVGVRNVLYEELPSRVWDPVEAVRCVEEVRATGWTVEPASFPADERVYAAKAAASECYRSQIDPRIRACLSVPERLWELTWAS